MCFRVFWRFFGQKYDFWGTTRSHDSIKLSADSLEVSWQDSNIFLNFWYDFRFLQPLMLTLLMQVFGLIYAAQRVQNCITMKKCRFFKVEDTFTMMQPRKKKHLTKVSSGLKTFYYHLRCSWDNLKKSILLPSKIQRLQHFSKECCSSATKSIFFQIISGTS